jgi:hypothetical protein
MKTNDYLIAVLQNCAILTFIAVMILSGHSPWWALILCFYQIHKDEKDEQ